jgi:hypothetical protein
MYSCGRFGGLAIEAMTGVDPFEPLITEVPFDSALGAARFLKKWGVNSVDEMMNAIFPRIPIFKAKRGDIVTVPADLGAEADEVAYGGMFATVGIADPPFFWALGVEGLAKGDLYGRANLRPYHAYSIGWDLPATNQATED